MSDFDKYSHTEEEVKEHLGIPKWYNPVPDQGTIENTIDFLLEENARLQKEIYDMRRENERETMDK